MHSRSVENSSSESATNDPLSRSLTMPSSVPSNGSMNGNMPTYECYVTRDLLTEPPTTVCVVPDRAHASTALARAGYSSDTLFVTFADIEPTAGWLSDRNNGTLDICFMHSFGKCFGKAKERNACTCHQIHVNPATLSTLRRYYKNPQRHYFCRTIKANVSDRFAQVLSLLARRRFSIQYLEFRKENVDVTAGSTAYEVSYRRWLLGDIPSGGAKVSEQPAAAYTSNYISEFNLCWDFSFTGRCPKGATCPDIHGHTEKALTKDRHVRLALEELKRKEATLDLHQCPNGPNAFAAGKNASRDSANHGAVGSSSQYMSPRAVHYGQAPVRPPPTPLVLPQGNAALRMMNQPAASHATQSVVDSPSLWQSGPVPPYYSASNFAPSSLPTYNSGPATSLPPPPVPPPPPAANMVQPFLQSNPQSNFPLFFISEGTDNVLRLVPVNGFGGYGTDAAQLSR